MTKDVLISIQGLQYEVSPDEATELIASGEYYFRNGKHYILYEEVLEDGDSGSTISKNTIKIADDQIELAKKGNYDVHMVFQKDKKNLTYYNTPFGQLLIGLYTTDFSIEEDDNSIHVKLEYDLEINNSFVSSCEINIKVTSKGVKIFS